MPFLAIVTSIVVCVAVALAGSFSASPDAEEVLDRFVEVTGGRAAYEALGGLELSGVYTGSHLRFYPGRGVVPMSAVEHAILVRELPVARAGWRDRWDEVAQLADGNIGSVATHEVELIRRDGGITVRRSFAQDSGLLLESRGPVGDIVIRYGDYREVEGVLIPFLVVVDQGADAHHEYHVRAAEGRIDVPDSVFAKPPAGLARVQPHLR